MKTSGTDLLNSDCPGYKLLGERYIESVKDFMRSLHNNTALDELIKKSVNIADLLDQIEQANKKRLDRNRDPFA